MIDSEEWVATSSIAPAGPDWDKLPGARLAHPVQVAGWSSGYIPASLSGQARPAGTAVTESWKALTNESFEVVPLLWATNRNIVRHDRGGEGAEYTPIAFGKRHSDTLAKGLALVTVPKVARPVGSIPVPRRYTFLTLELYSEKEDPKRHFTIGRMEELSDIGFLQQASLILGPSVTYRDHCLVYVHGFNNSFSDAIHRTAQLVVDMGFDGAGFVFSWPSEASLAGYIADREAVDASQTHFRQFIDLLNGEVGCARIHIIAHSLGTKLVVDSFFPASGATPLSGMRKIDQIVLASPDIDATVLRSRAASIGASAKTVTLYANGNDNALDWSRRAARGKPRAGDVVDGKPVVIAGIDSIDLTPMSEATWVFVGANHSEYAERAHVLQDIALLLRDGVRPPDRRFPVYRRVTQDGETFWRYVSN